MFTIMCYKYLSANKIDKEIYDQATGSHEIVTLGNILSDIKDEFDNYDGSTEDIDYVFDVGESIYEYVLEAVESFNCRWTQLSYMYIDEIIPIKIKDNKSLVLISDEGRSPESKNNVAKAFSYCLELLKSQGLYDGIKDEDIDDIIYLIFMDIIPKNQPTFLLYPDGYK